MRKGKRVLITDGVNAGGGCSEALLRTVSTAFLQRIHTIRPLLLAKR